MKFASAAVLLVLSLTTYDVLGQKPSTVCFPETFQCKLYESMTLGFGDVAVDFSKRLVARRSDSTDIRFVIDYNTNITYYINTTTGGCTKSKTTFKDSDIPTKCLSKKAMPFSNAYFGLDDKSLSIQTWETVYDNNDRVRFAMTTDRPAIPIIRQYIENGSNQGMLIYVNGTQTVDPKIFKLPKTCNDRIAL